MSDIFISYASEDKGRVQALARALERKGWSVWWDRRIPAGKSFDEVIHEALKNARSVVVVWTKTSIKSTWVKNESRSGLRRNILFPVMLLDEVEIPLEFEHLQAAHLMDWQPEQDHAGFDQFIDDLAEVIGPPVTQRQAAPALPAKPTPEPEKEPRPGVVRAALAGDNNLSALTLSPGTLEPAFAASTTDYTVNVASDVTSVNVSATKADPNAMISGDVSVGAGVATGERTIELRGPGTTTGVTIWVTAPGGSQKTYRLNVSRAALSGNNNLQSLTLSSGTLSPSFSANRMFYTVNVDGDVPHITVTPTLQDANASLTINGQGTGSGKDRPITLAPAGSSTEIEIIVTAPNGSDKTYLITVSRAALPRPAEVEPEPSRQEPEPSYARAGAGDSESPRESFGSKETTGVREESVQVGEDRSSQSSQSTGAGSSTQSFPYLPIGIGILAVMGALVYFLLFSQGSPTVTREVVPYEPPVQAPSPRTEVTSPSPVPEPMKQPSPAPTKEEPTAKREAIADGTVAAKSRRVAGPAKAITGKDGAPMVLVPAGEFMMGSRADDQSADDNERPAHRVYLDAYYIDQYEVTTARYAKFFKATNRPQPEYWSADVVSDHGNKPVVGVDWTDATAYCSWAGKRLPTEAEWEKAARGTDQRLYPWGNQPPNEQRAKFFRRGDFQDYGELTDVGSYEAGKSPYGVYDMAGNVWEWTADWYDEKYYSKSPEKNPKGPSSGEYRVVRGGGWIIVSVDVRYATRSRLTPALRRNTVGFRCAQDIPK